MKQWSNTVILRVLRNEKYCGDLIQKKTFTPNYLNHEKKYNRGEEEFVTLRDHHEPIISRELFEKAQTELARRSPNEEQKAKHSNRYCFSGKIKCGICGCTFVSRSKKRKDGSVYKAWRCYEGAKNGASHFDKANNQVGCSCMSLNDEDAKLMLQELIKGLKLDQRKIIDNLTGIIQKVIGEDGPSNKNESIQAKITQVTEKKQRLLELYLSKDISKQDFQEMNTKYESENTVLLEEAEAGRRQEALRENKDVLLSQISSALEDIAINGEWDDTFYRHILDKMVVHEGGKLDICLNLFPTKWRFAAVSGANRHFDASLPTSFRIPMACL